MESTCVNYQNFLTCTNRVWNWHIPWHKNSFSKYLQRYAKKIIKIAETVLQELRLQAVANTAALREEQVNEISTKLQIQTKLLPLHFYNQCASNSVLNKFSRSNEVESNKTTETLCEELPLPRCSQVMNLKSWDQNAMRVALSNFASNLPHRVLALTWQYSKVSKAKHPNRLIRLQSY